MSRLLSLLAITGTCLAKTVNLDWSVDWISASPDGFTRPVIGLNGQWPCPPVEVDIGDTIITTVKNNLGNETTGIHFHGELQHGSNYADGVSMVNQCPIPPGSTFTQQFTANTAGTHWYHSHNGAQFPDGFRAPFIVHDKAYENTLGYDKEYLMTVSDWYHTQTPYLIHDFISGGRIEAPPTPDSSLINDAQTTSYDLVPGKKYLFRIIAMSAFGAFNIQFEDHKMTIVALDGVPSVPTEADYVTIAAGQRVDVMITAKDKPTKNYSILSKMTTSSFYNNGVLKYGSNLAAATPVTSIRGNTADDFNIQPLDKEPLLGTPTHSIQLDVSFSNVPNAGPRIKMGNYAYVTPKVPTLYTALSTGADALNATVYGPASNPYILNSGEIVEVTINNLDGFMHPIHLHGHRYQVVSRGQGSFNNKAKRQPDALFGAWGGKNKFAAAAAAATTNWNQNNNNNNNNNNNQNSNQNSNSNSNNNNNQQNSNNNQQNSNSNSNSNNNNNNNNQNSNQNSNTAKTGSSSTASASYSRPTAAQNFGGNRYSSGGQSASNVNDASLPAIPMKRDTVTTVPGGHLVIRFRADNPGVFVMHCHMEWHVPAGMLVTFIEAPDQLQKTLTVPQSHYDMCKAQGIPTAGNCAGNTQNVYDVSQCRTANINDWGALVNPVQNAGRRRRTIEERRGQPHV